MINLSLKTKITVVVSFLVVLLTSLGLYAGLLYFERQFKEALFKQQAGMVSIVADEIDSKLATYRAELVAVSRRITPEILKDRRLAQRYIDGHEDTRLMFDNGLYIFLPNGRILAGSEVEPEMWGQDYSSREYFKATILTGKPQISEPFITIQRHGHPVVMFTAPVFDAEGKLLAFLGGSLDLMKDNILGRLSRSRIHTTGYFYLFNTSRMLIVHPNRDRILKDPVPSGANRLLDRALQGDDPSGETVTSWGAPMVSSFRHLKQVPWILALSYPQEDAYAPLDRAKQFVAAVVPLMLAGSLLIVWLCLRMLTEPLLRFTEHVGKIADQDRHEPFVVETGDEIGAMGVAFNQMLAELDSQKQTVQKQLHFLQELIDTIPNPVFFKDADGRYLGCNRAFESYLGKSREELVGKGVYDLAPKELADIYFRADAELFARRGTQVYEASVRYADGSTHDVIFYKATFEDADGALGGLVGTLLDITERKKAEKELEEQRAFAVNLVQNSTIPSFVIDADHKVIIWNKACENLTGMKAEKVEGTDQQWSAFYSAPRPCLADLVVNGDAARIPDHYVAFGESDLVAEGYWSEGWFPNLGGKDRFLLFTAAPIRNSRGDLVGAIETLEDITDRKRAQEEILKTVSLLNSTIEATADGILVTGLDKSIVRVNRRFLELFDIPEESMGQGDVVGVLGSHFEQLKDPDAGKAKFEQLYLYPDRESVDVMVFKDGRQFVRVCKPQWEGDTVVGRVCSFRDETEHRKLESQLRQAQKMEAVGTLSGGIAHDFNNILTAIIGYANLMQMKIDSADPLYHFLGQILASADKAAGLTRSLLAYSRKQPINPISVDVNDIVRKVERLLSRLIGEDIELVTVLADEKLTVLADSLQIEQVLMNLATNARDALDGAGSLIITTRLVELDADFAQRHGYGAVGRYALIAVSDTGAGMDEKVRERIFEPFFTTKEVGRGTGLGLSIVYGIVKQHNGFIDVYSEPGKGTTFKFYLPLTAEPARCIAPEIVPSNRGGDETILLIEDNTEVRQLVRDVLVEYGYRVIEAVDGEDGVQKFIENRDRIRLMIVDVIMPKKNGKQVYDEIRQLGSDVRVIFVSGYTAEIIDRKGVLEPGVNFLQKPLMPSMLLAKIREVLDAETCTYVI